MTFLTRVHRWLGLATALFLFVAGSTGALIAWEPELDALLAREFHRSASGAPAVFTPLELADRFEAAEPRARVKLIEELDPAPGDAVVLWIESTFDPVTGAPYALDFDHVAFDPATGREQGRRLWGRVSLAPRDLMSFLYELHASLHFPDGGGRNAGELVLGIVALVWLLDGCVALWISFPNPRRWTRSFAFRVREGGLRLLFDVHRSGGVWMWPLLVVFAVTSVSLNLHDEVFAPAVASISTLTPDPFDELEQRSPERSDAAAVTRAEAVELARAEVRRRGWTAPASGLFWSPSPGAYGVGFYEAGEARGEVGLGNPWVYVDGTTGEVFGADVPGTGTAGDLFVQLQFPIHSGRILGVPGRIIVSLLGVVVATLSASGLALWARRRIRAARMVV